MKNKSGFYIKSAACKEAVEKGLEGISFRCTESQAWDTVIEWHHGGSGIIAFFPKNKEEKAKIKDLQKSIKNQAIKSKAAFWRVVAKDENRGKDYGYGTIDAKQGKYGWFACSYGEPDAVFGLTAEAFEFLQKGGL